MHTGAFGLGIDIGDGTVTAAVCRPGDGEAGPAALRLGATGAGARATAVLTGDGGVRLGSDRDDVGGRVVAHAMGRVGTPTPFSTDRGGIPAADVVAAIVREVCAVAEEQEGRAPDATVVVVPPSWKAHRHTVLTEALAAAVPGGAFLVSGAVAVAYHHVAAGDLPADPAVAVYDLGASTLDTAVVGPVAGGLGHLAVPPDPFPWGGRDIDDALLDHVLRSTDGTGLGIPGTRADAQVLRDRTVAAKEALSLETATVVALDSGAPLRVTREELDELIAPRAEAAVDALRTTIAAARLAEDELDGVVLAGGGARLPLVAESVSAGLGRPLVVSAEPELAPALGAARLAADELVGPGDTEPPVLAEPDEDTVADDRHQRTHRTSPVRRPAREGPDTRPVGPRGGRRSLRRPETRRNLTRTTVVAGMFLALVVIGPATSAVFSADVGPAPTEAVADTGSDPIAPSGTTAGTIAEPGAVPTDELFAEVEVQAAADSRPLGSASAPETSSARAAEQQTLTEPTTEAGTTTPTASAPTTSAPGTTSSTPTPGPAPAQDPGPATEVPAPDPSPAPQPDPGPDPTTEPEPDPVPAPDPEPAPEPEPAPDGDSVETGDATSETTAPTTAAQDTP